MNPPKPVIDPRSDPMDYHTPLRDLLGVEGAHGVDIAIRVAGHIPDGEWALHGPIGAPTSAHVRCSPCGEVLRVVDGKLKMSRSCPGPTPGRWR